MDAPGMTFFEAEELLESIGHRQDWTPEELFAATPEDMRESVLSALEICAAEYAARAIALEAWGERRWGAQ